MKDADHLRAQAARCVALQCGARRADVQHALGCLAQEYEAAARGTEQWRDDHGAALAILRLPLAWPVLVTQRHLTTLLRASLAFRLPL